MIPTADMALAWTLTLVLPLLALAVALVLGEWFKVRK